MSPPFDYRRLQLPFAPLSSDPPSSSSPALLPPTPLYAASSIAPISPDDIIDSNSDEATAIQAPMKSKLKTRQPRNSRLRNAHSNQAKAMSKASNLSGGLGS